jgi:DNA repair protein RadC
MPSSVGIRAMADLRVRLNGSQAVFDYLSDDLSEATTERLRVLFLDGGHYLLSDEALAEGTCDEVPMCPRSIMIRALELRARGMILVHNHPSGDPRPSDADLEATRRVVDAARTLDLRVYDHVIIARHGATSFCMPGLM